MGTYSKVYAMLDESERNLRNIQDKIFEQSLDLVYFSNMEFKVKKTILQVF